MRASSGRCREPPERHAWYWNTIYIQLGLDALPGRPADDELAGLMPPSSNKTIPLGCVREGQFRDMTGASAPLGRQAPGSTPTRRLLLTRTSSELRARSCRTQAALAADLL